MLKKINAVRCTIMKNEHICLCCHSCDVDSQFCSCDASVFTVSHFRPHLPSVYEITVTLYVFLRRMILIYATLSVKCVNM